MALKSEKELNGGQSILRSIVKILKAVSKPLSPLL